MRHNQLKSGCRISTTTTASCSVILQHIYITFNCEHCYTIRYSTLLFSHSSSTSSDTTVSLITPLSAFTLACSYTVLFSTLAPKLCWRVLKSMKWLQRLLKCGSRHHTAYAQYVFHPFVQPSAATVRGTFHQRFPKTWAQKTVWFQIYVSRNFIGCPFALKLIASQWQMWKQS